MRYEQRYNRISHKLDRWISTNDPFRKRIKFIVPIPEDGIGNFIFSPDTGNDYLAYLVHSSGYVYNDYYNHVSNSYGRIYFRRAWVVPASLGESSLLDMSTTAATIMSTIPTVNIRRARCTVIIRMVFTRVVMSATTVTMSSIPTDFRLIDYFQISPKNWWLRSPYPGWTIGSYACLVIPSGDVVDGVDFNVIDSYGRIRRTHTTAAMHGT